jgi:hypothetical protein
MLGRYSKSQPQRAAVLARLGVKKNNGVARVEEPQNKVKAGYIVKTVALSNCETLEM